MAAPLFMLLMAVTIVTAIVLFIIFVVVPILQAVSSVIRAVFVAVGWAISHIWQFVSGMFQDTIRFIGSIPAMLVFSTLCVVNIIFARWSAASHFGETFVRELRVAGTCLYRVFIQRPLRLLLLDGLLEGLEQRVPEALSHSPPADNPTRKAGTFDGYTIVGSLPGGGSGAKLYVAVPSPEVRRRWSSPHRLSPEEVVIKSFALTDGSSLPQIVRESRALESARQLGLVLDHHMDEHRFYYVMPYHPGEHLGIITRQRHGEGESGGLSIKHLRELTGYVQDLLLTLKVYHANGLWHKDVKPENLIVHDSRAHLVDLGLVTPLSSGMTLTTHGTEYFRDPELVRQALRGVKVHQVDGTKFDIYAAGAVLYFVLENTFPAHGGLSQIRRRCPEALRWIVRRAMTDYDKRYADVEQMLADLRVVREAHDPFAVKPAALPSMRGGADASGAETVETNVGVDDRADDVEPEGVRVAAAGSPIPPIPPVPPVGAAPPFSAGKGEESAGRSEARSAGSGRRGPKIKVTNWWTGTHDVEDPGDPGLGVKPDELRAHVNRIVRDAKHTAKAAVREARQAFASAFGEGEGSVVGTRTAREQREAAWRRVRDRQNKANRRRVNTVTANGVSKGVWVVLVLFLLAFAWLFLSVFQAEMRPVVYDSARVGTTHIPASLPAGWSAPQFAMSSERPILVLNDHPLGWAGKVGEEIKVNLAALEDQGIRFETESEDAEVAVRKLIPFWERSTDHFVTEQLRDTLDEFMLGGILRIRAEESETSERLTAVTWINPASDDSGQSSSGRSGRNTRRN